ncbi:histidine kinase [Pseudomonas stutzeri]|uniref:sensor histidine kinase n=1 Tax=Stutzerimonas stutzeri TaxID=316 RepID=UPI0015E19AB6|nr:histidine kinase [Stutzerimonas stutzeri]MCQ4295755.1 histidine kinase [Stutzerimonas stutzeri]
MLDEAHERQQKVYQSMVASLPEGLVIVRDGRVHYSNAAACGLFNPAGAAQSGELQLEHCIDPAQRAREADRLSKLQRGLIEAARFRHIRLVRLDGTSFQAEVTEIPLENDGHQDVLLLIRDISEPERMRLELEQANQRLQHLSQRLMAVQENQRRQLARDLHDDIGQQLTGMKLHLQRVAGKLEHEPALARLIDQLTEAADETLTKVRSLSLALHPLQLETLGLAAAVHWHLSRFLEAAQTRWTLKVDGETVALPANVSLVAFRIVQEAVNNVARHAGDCSVRVLICRTPEALRVEVIDDGKGFDIKTACARAQSLGLTSMQERAAALGGELNIASLSGVGTQVTASLPISDEAPPNGEST